MCTKWRAKMWTRYPNKPFKEIWTSGSPLKGHKGDWGRAFGTGGWTETARLVHPGENKVCECVLMMGSEDSFFSGVCDDRTREFVENLSLEMDCLDMILGKQLWLTRLCTDQSGQTTEVFANFRLVLILSFVQPFHFPFSPVSLHEDLDFSILSLLSLYIITCSI